MTISASSRILEIAEGLPTTRPEDAQSDRCFLGRGSLPEFNVFIFLLFTEGSECILYSVTEDIKHMSKPSDLVQGTLDMLLLKILALEPMKWLRRRSTLETGVG
jgi:hypothetical protein